MQVRLLLHAPSGTCFLMQAVLSAVQRSAGSATWPACRAELLGDAFWGALAAHDASATSSEQVWAPTKQGCSAQLDALSLRHLSAGGSRQVPRCAACLLMGFLAAVCFSKLVQFTLSFSLFPRDDACCVQMSNFD